MKEFKQNGRTFLAVEVPDCEGYEMFWMQGFKQSAEENGNKIIGLSSELTEEQAKQTVEFSEYTDLPKDYLKTDEAFTVYHNITAKESLASRLASLNLSGNILIIEKL